MNAACKDPTPGSVAAGSTGSTYGTIGMRSYVRYPDRPLMAGT